MGAGYHARVAVTASGVGNVRGIAILSALLAISVGERVASAEDLDTALSLEREGRLEEALASFETALLAEGNTTEELRTIFQHLGMLRFAAGNADGARRALLCLRALDREPELPTLAPPEVQALLVEVSREWGGRTLRIEVAVEHGARAAGPIRVLVRVVDDLAAMVAGAEVRLGARVLARAEGGGPFALELPAAEIAGVTTGLTARLLDDHAGVLAEAGFAAAPESTGAGTALGAGEREHRRARSRPAWIVGWSLLGAGLLAVGGGGALVGLDGTPTGDVRTGDGYRDVEELATAPGGWALFGTGAAAAVAGVVLVIIQARRPRARPGRVAPVAGSTW
jgi:hypothetical protein